VEKSHRVESIHGVAAFEISYQADLEVDEIGHELWKECGRAVQAVMPKANASGPKIHDAYKKYKAAFRKFQWWRYKDENGMWRWKSGVSYDESTHRINTSDFNWNEFVKKYGRPAEAIRRAGFPYYYLQEEVFGGMNASGADIRTLDELEMEDDLAAEASSDVGDTQSSVILEGDALGGSILDFDFYQTSDTEDSRAPSAAAYAHRTQGGGQLITHERGSNTRGKRASDLSSDLAEPMQTAAQEIPFQHA
jgi:hypothetical protein